jgi:tRNA(Ile)-lysidine synthase
MWRQIKKDIQKRDDKYVIAVSGGIDSMFALHFVQRCLSKEQIVVATFDHGDHPDSRKFCEFVADYCKERNIQCEIGEGFTDVELFKQQGGIETMHRQQRYNFLNSVCKKFSINTIMTAHHLNDQIETILLRLFRGYPHQFLAMENSINYNVYRPFLEVERKTIERMVRYKNIPYMDDPTNVSMSYERNWLRHDIIPQLLKKRNIVKAMYNGLNKTRIIGEGYGYGNRDNPQRIDARSGKEIVDAFKLMLQDS